MCRQLAGKELPLGRDCSLQVNDVDAAVAVGVTGRADASTRRAVRVYSLPLRAQDIEVQLAHRSVANDVA